jgi:hypothetical protein
MVASAFIGSSAIAANDSVSIQRSERASLKLFDEAQNDSAPCHDFCAQMRPSDRLRTERSEAQFLLASSELAGIQSKVFDVWIGVLWLSWTTVVRVRLTPG